MCSALGILVPTCVDGVTCTTTGYSSLALTLSEETDRVRLVQGGGTAALLDAVALDGSAPLAVEGSSDASASSPRLTTT